MKLQEFTTERAWIDAVVEELDAAAEEALRRGATTMHLCLAGGGTPAPVYAALAAHPLAGVELGLWPGDERLVGRDDPARNGAMIAAVFSAATWKPAPRLWLWPDESPRGREGPLPDRLEDRFAAAELLCARHESTLRAELGESPSFDLALLGLGPDGHTASLFPGQKVLGEQGRFCAAALAPAEPRVRMSFTYPALERSKKILFLVRGHDKADIVGRLASGDAELPAARLGAGDRVILYCRE